MLVPVSLKVTTPVQEAVVEFADYQETTVRELGKMYFDEQQVAIADLDVFNVLEFQQPSLQVFGTVLKGAKSRSLGMSMPTKTFSFYEHHSERFSSFAYLARIAFLRGLSLNMIENSFKPELLRTNS